MGYTYRNNGLTKDFWPDDTENEIYIECGMSLLDIMSAVKDKWGENLDIEDVNIRCEYIHTYCLGYDLHDSSDYTNFIVVSKQEK